MNEFKATDKWYQDAAESETGHDFEVGGSEINNAKCAQHLLDCMEHLHFKNVRDREYENE